MLVDPVPGVVERPGYPALLSMSPITTSVEPLEANKVRLRVEVPAADFEQALDAAFRKLAREVKVPGFRPGKAPRALLEARLGSEVATRAGAAGFPAGVLRRGGGRRGHRRHRRPRDRPHRGRRGRRRRASTRSSRSAPSCSSRATTTCASRSRTPPSPTRPSTHQVDQLRERFADLEDNEGTAHRRRRTRTIDIKGYDARRGRRRARARPTSSTASAPAGSSPSSTRSCAGTRPARSSSSTTPSRSASATGPARTWRSTCS